MQRLVAARTRSPHWEEGDAICAHKGWQTHGVARGDDPALMLADTRLAPLSAWLGVVGMPGRTAYLGLQRVGRPRAGETLVVSAAFAGLFRGESSGKQLVRVAKDA